MNSGNKKVSQRKGISDVVWILFVVSVLAFSGYRAHRQAQDFESHRLVTGRQAPDSLVVRAEAMP